MVHVLVVSKGDYAANDGTKHSLVDRELMIDTFFTYSRQDRRTVGCDFEEHASS